MSNSQDPSNGESYHHKHQENEDYSNFDEDQFNFDKLPARDQEVLEKEFSLNLTVHEIENSLHGGDAKEKPQNEKVPCPLCGGEVKHQRSLKKHQDSKKCQSNRLTPVTNPCTTAVSEVISKKLKYTCNSM